MTYDMTNRLSKEAAIALVGAETVEHFYNGTMEIDADFTNRCMEPHESDLVEFMASHPAVTKDGDAGRLYAVWLHDADEVKSIELEGLNWDCIDYFIFCD